jgi:hypothetical protein
MKSQYIGDIREGLGERQMETRLGCANLWNYFSQRRRGWASPSIDMVTESLRILMHFTFIWPGFIGSWADSPSERVSPLIIASGLSWGGFH